MSLYHCVFQCAGVRLVVGCMGVKKRGVVAAAAVFLLKNDSDWIKMPELRCYFSKLSQCSDLITV